MFALESNALLCSTQTSSQIPLSACCSWSQPKSGVACRAKKPDSASLTFSSNPRRFSLDVGGPISETHTSKLLKPGAALVESSDMGAPNTEMADVRREIKAGCRSELKDQEVVMMVKLTGDVVGRTLSWTSHRRRRRSGSAWQPYYYSSALLASCCCCCYHYC